MDDMTGRFGIGTMHAVFEVVGTVFAEKHALNIMGGKNLKKNALGTLGAILSGPVALLGFTCFKYSWCNVIWASGCVGFTCIKYSWCNIIWASGCVGIHTP